MADQTSHRGSGGARLAKVIARAGLASRRDAEAMIAAGRVSVNGKSVTSPATNVTPRDRVSVDGKDLPDAEGARLWLYHKPAGLVTSAKDEKGRETVFDALPDALGRVLSVGRLDITSEGLLLLTNDGGLKRQLELPETGWLRRYRVRVNGTPDDGMLAPLREGITVDGERFGEMQVTLDRQQGANAWLTIGLREGKNREIRRAMDAVGLAVNRLIRVSYGPFQLGKLAVGAVEEVRPRILREQLGGIFEGPLAEARQVADARAGRDGPGGGRRPRPSGDRLIQKGRGGDVTRKPKGGASTEPRPDRAARPAKLRTAKPPVTRNDGEGLGKRTRRKPDRSDPSVSLRKGRKPARPKR
ncbi:MAG: pseudouridine synthase [Pseudomonadota bacterium]